MGEILNKLYSYIVIYGMNVLAAGLIVIVGRWVGHIAADLVSRILLKAGVDKTISSFAKNIIRVSLLIFVFIAALNKLGVQTASLIAVLGAAGIAIGLALQGSLANFAAGILLIFFKPFKVGDFIACGGAEGFVEDVEVFCTSLRTFDNLQIIIPNAKITADNIINFSSFGKRRIDLVFSVSYTDDLSKAKRALKDVVSRNDRVLKSPAPVIAVSELADSSVNLVCRPWVKPDDYWDVYFELIENGKVALEKSGCTIPFPQHDVHIINNKIEG
ncbi:MAG: mechanosensitive ion channel family protein [Candidatus Omnitrophota bacterium]|nr:MAG: mechanosensitive ion channel family protein [Candidatus Omnitrophota bacterium]